MKVLKKIGIIFGYILLAVMLLLIIANVYLAIAKKTTGKLQPTIFGFSSAIVETWSMQPEINPNDYIITKSQTEYAVNDIILFEDGNSLTTHRIIEVTNSGYRTKGDANESADTNIVFKYKVVGKVIFKIPKIGLIIKFFKTTEGIISLVLIFLTFISLEFYLTKRKKKI